ncbi:TonB-dependent receptor [Ideonella sp. DXS29W]|uniref:TonB-dependent receptor n=1 Tax=Ideonella lacteola TaxID=2984193 RepID=A0ABU9BTM5_9BURK
MRSDSNPLFLRRPTALAALALVAAAGAVAQPRPPTAGESQPNPSVQTPGAQTVVVTGQAANLRHALDAQQEADRIVSIVRADGIGQWPDSNAAEALQRLPGVSIENDQGEGRYVRVRGLGPDLNGVSINGALVPSPESSRRAVALDVLPAGLIRSLEVSKTLTPDQDANAIGGHVEVVTLSAFDHRGRFISAELGLGHDDLTGRTSPRGNVIWSDRFLDGKLGVALGASSEQRRFGSDNVETGGAWDGDKLEEFERRDYLITRQRDALALNLDYRPADGERYMLRSFASRFADTEHREAQVIEFNDAQLPGDTGDAEVTRELKSRTETQHILSLQLAAERRLGDWKLQASLGASQAGEDLPRHIPGAAFEGLDTFSGVGFTRPSQPRLIGPASLYDAGSYSLDSIEVARGMTTDNEQHAQLDVARRWSGEEWAGEWKLGTKISRRHKRNNEDSWVVDSDAVAATSMSDYTHGQVDYALGAFGPALSSSRLWAALKGLDLADFVDDEESRVADYDLREDVDAAYLQATIDIGRWRWIAGVRHESARLLAQGTALIDGDFSALRAEQRHHAWLPGVHARYDLDDQTSVRAAWSHSLVRPTFEQLAPGTVIDGDEASFGNPHLAPTRATHFDLGIERRLGRDGAISAYAFHKRLHDFVYRTDLAGSGDWAGFDEAETYVNGGRAQVSGIELSWAQALRGLPAPFDGLVLGANATFSRSRARITDGGPDGASRDIRLPSQSDRSVNLMLGYEAGPFSVRLAATHKSAYLLEVPDVSDARQDQWVAAQTQLDLTTRCQIDRDWQLSAQVQNLTNESYDVHAGSRDHNVQHEQYGRTFKLGLKYTAF